MCFCLFYLPRPVLVYFYCLCWVVGKTRLQSDLLCVERDIKLYSLTHSLARNWYQKLVFASKIGCKFMQVSDTRSFQNTVVQFDLSVVFWKFLVPDSWSYVTPVSQQTPISALILCFYQSQNHLYLFWWMQTEPLFFWCFSEWLNWDCGLEVILFHAGILSCPFRALTLLVGRPEVHPAHKNVCFKRKAL